MTLYDASIRTSRILAMLLALGHSAVACTWGESSASESHMAALDTSWDSSSSMGQTEAALRGARRELGFVCELLPKLESRLSDDSVRTYLRELDKILKAAEGDEAHLVANAAALNMQLATTRARLTSTTGSSGVWLSVAKVVAPDAGPYRVPGHLLKRATLGPKTFDISISDIDDVLIAQDSLAFMEA